MWNIVSSTEHYVGSKLRSIVSRSTHFPYNMKLYVLQIPIEAIDTFLIIFINHMNTLYTIKMKIFVHIEWLYRSPPQFMWIIEPIMVIVF